MDDEEWMGEALKEAAKALNEDEVPVGAVVVRNNEILGRGHNRVEALKDPTAHAEIIAISAACNQVGNWRLEGTTVYVTLEPCLMCVGALILARVKRLVFGAQDPRFGCCGSVYDLAIEGKFDHRFEVSSGILAESSKELLRRFFEKRRRKD
jgi:tRNA(adenine34) deaminase